jgi:hypothetical protein
MADRTASTEALETTGMGERVVGVGLGKLTGEGLWFSVRIMVAPTAPSTVNQRPIH